jgi:signal transduction histidine kinase
MIFILTEEYEIIYYNNKVSSVLNVPHSMIIYKKFFDLFETEVKMLDKEQQLSESVILNCYVKGNKDFVGEINVSKVIMGERKFFLCLIRDIKKRMEIKKQLENLNEKLQIEVDKKTKKLQDYTKKLEKTNKKLKNSNEELKKIDFLKNEFISIASHEIKTPLTSITGYIEYILNKDCEERDKELLKIVYKEAIRLKNIVHDMLTLEKIESGKEELNLEDINIDKFFEHLKNMFSNQTQNIKFEFKRHFEFNNMIVDKDKLHVIFVNLISNSIKFMDKEEKIIEINVYDNGEHLLFEHYDNGIGIPMKYQKKVFEKFFQVQNHLTRNKQGTGLGLSIVSKYVNLHKGKITMRSTEKKYTKIMFTIQKFKL